MDNSVRSDIFVVLGGPFPGIKTTMCVLLFHI
jgi:hypothetical protein